jgi:hypothetical protein
MHNQEGFNNDNPGLYYKRDNGFTAGTYYNSVRQQTFYAGYSQSTSYGFDLSYALMSGYREYLVPTILPSVKIGFTRLTLAYNPFGASALHLSIEKEL